MARMWIVCGALLGGAGVALGAYGAHGLSEHLEGRLVARGVDEADRPQALALRQANYDTAVRYQMIHAVALVLTGLVAARRTSAWAALAGLLFLAGIALFSGLLFAQVFDGPRVHWSLIPSGGMALIIGWLFLAPAGWCAAAAEQGIANVEGRVSK